MIYQYFSWWYGVGWRESYKTAVALLYKTVDFFSLEILIETWFAPWKNDVLTLKGAALDDQVKVWEQNLVSRLFGALIRTVIILVGAALLGLLTVVMLTLLIFWAVVPLLIFILPLLSAWVVK